MTRTIWWRMSMYCPAADGLYLRANGSFVCWNSPGEMCPIVKVGVNDLEHVDFVRDVLNGDAFRQMRRALHEQRDPFDFCESCTWGCAQGDDQWSRVGLHTFELRSIRTLQVEPSFLCNLECPQCIPLADRKSGPPPYVLDPKLFRRLVDDLVRHGIGVGAIQYGGFGEPLMSPHFPEIARYAKQHLGSVSACDSNGNFDFREELADCGLDWFVLAFDGVNQRSYERYRRRGNLARLLRFAADACAAGRRLGDARTRVAWKMVLFKWNSSEDDLREACRLANEIGVDVIRFVNTTTPGGISSRRRPERWREIHRLVGELAATSRVPVLLEGLESQAGEINRCHGFLERLSDSGDAVELGGWVLLDDGPPDRILVTSSTREETSAVFLNREDLVAEHPKIPGARGGGFFARLPVSAHGLQAEYSLTVRLLRGGEERVRFSVRCKRGIRWVGNPPMKIRNGGALHAT